MMKEDAMSARGWGGAEHTHGRARGTLETREATVTLNASVALFACLTLVTTGALGSLEERGGEDGGVSGVSSSCGARGGFLPRHDEDLSLGDS